MRHTDIESIIYSNDKDRKKRNPQENRKLRPGEVVEEKKVKAKIEILRECYPLYCRDKDLTISVNGILICI